MLQQDGATGRAAAGKVRVKVARGDVASVRIVDTDLVFTLKDGRKVYVRDGAVQSMVDQGFAVEFSDGETVSGQELLQSAGTAEVGRIAVTGSADADAAGVLTQAAPAESVAAVPAAAAASSGGIKQWLLIGTPIVGGVLAGVLASGGGSTPTTDPGTGTGSGNVKPSTPVIVVVAGDDKVSGAERAAGVTVRGTSEPSLAVTVIWGTTTKTATADASGQWSVSFASGEVPADAAGTTISASVKSATGVVSDPGVRTVLVDTTAPGAPVIGTVAGDNIVGPSEAQSGVQVSGSAEAGSIVNLSWGSVTRSLLVDAVGNWSASFASSEVPAAGSYTITATATDGLGNVGAAGSRAVTVSPAVTVSGIITAGPVIAGNGLTVNIFRGDGSQVASSVRVNADGTFTATGLALGVNDVVIVRVTDGSPGFDYTDEATGSPKDLNAQLMAVGVVTGGTVTVNVNPLTTIAAQKAGVNSDGTGTVTSPTTVTVTNAAVATAFGLPGVDILTTTPTPTNGGNYNPVDGLTNGEKIGAVLASFSGVDGINNGNAQKSIDDLAQNVVITGTVGTVTVPGQTLLMEGAAVAEPNVEGSLQQAISDGLSAANSGPQLTITTIAGDNIVSSSEAAGLVIGGTVAVGASAVRLRFGTASVAATVSGSQWTYAVTPTDIANLGADGAKVLTAEAVLGNGTIATASRPVVLAAQPPATPVINAISTDNAINAAEKNAGISINGTATPDTTVNLSWGLVTRTARVASNGLWSFSFTPQEVPADGATNVEVRVSDAFGNTSATARRSVLVDTIAPVAPAIGPVAGDDLVGPVEVTGGVVVSGSAEALSTVRITWGSVTRTATTDATGVWTTRFTTAQVPADGEYTLSAVQLDPAGNVSAEATRVVTVDVQPPTPPTISPVATDNIVNAAEKLAGIAIRGTAEANTRIEVTWGPTTRTTTTNAAGAWSASFTASQVPADGQTTVSATAIDSSGNTSEVRTRSVVVDTASGSLTINPIAGDGLVNATEKANGVIVSGTAEVGSSVAVTIAGNTRRAAADASGNWSTSFDAALVPADGPSEVTVRATDPAQNLSPQVSRTFVIDTGIPTAPVIGVVAGDDRVGSQERDTGVPITGTSEAAARIVVRWGTASRVATADADGNWTVNFSPADVPSDGATAVTATATDAAGNVSPEGARPVIVDTFVLPPALNIVAENDVINAAEKLAGVTVSGSTEPLATVNVRWGTVTRLTVADASGSFATTFSEAEIPASGNSSISATAIDLNGNVSATRTRPVVIDTDVNPPTINTVTSDSVINAAEQASGVTVTGTAEAGGSVTLAWGGLTRTVTVDASGNWSAAFAPTEVPADGTLPVTATVTDAAGNPSAVTTRSVRVDTVAPVAPDIAVVAGEDVVNAAERNAGINITGKGEAGAAISVTWGNATRTTTADAAGDWLVTFSPLSVPGDGLTTVSVTQRDTAGNLGPAANRSVRVDTGQPLAPVIDLVAGDDVINLAERTSGFAITGTAQARSSVQVTLGSAVRTVTAGADGVWTASFVTADVPPDGSRNVTAIQTDLNGNASLPATRPIQIDTAPPTTPTIGLVAINDIVNATEKASSVAVSGTATAGTLVTVTWGTTTKTVTAAGANTWSLSFGATEIPADGNSQIVATATDSAGNPSSPVSRPVTIDTTAAGAPVIDAVATDNTVNAAEAASGVAVTGTAEARSSVLVNWNGATQTVTTGSDGKWGTFFASGTVPVNGSTNITATQTDLAGNTSVVGSRAVVVNRNSPGRPVISQVATDDVINATEKAAGVNVTGTGVANAVVEVTLGTVTKTVTATSGGAWTANFTPTDIPIDGFTTVTARQTDPIGNTSDPDTRNLTVDTQPPTVPVISFVATDNNVNAAEKNNGVTISGTAIAGSRVNVTWGAVSKQVVALDGTWNATFGSTEVPNDGETTVRATATDPAGNQGSEATRTVTVATGAPDAPFISAVAADDTVNAAEAQNPVTVSGTGQAGATVRVDWNGVIKNAPVNSLGDWSSIFLSGELPTINGTTQIRVRQTDTSGNVGPEFSRSVDVIRTPPAQPSINPITSDNIVSGAEKTNGVPVSGTGIAGATVEVKFGNTTKFVVADTNGAWSTSFVGSEIPIDGDTTVQARQTNAIGNTSAFINRPVTVDTAPPATPGINVVSTDGRVNATEKSQSVSVSGTADTGSIVTVTWGSTSKTLTAVGGTWSTSFSSGEVPADGSTSITAQAADAAGNLSSSTNLAVTVDTVGPAAPGLNAVAGDNRVGVSEAANPIVVSGTGEVGATVTVNWGGFVRTAIVQANSIWSLSYPSGQIPGDGSTVMTVTQTDVAGNVGPVPTVRTVDIDSVAPTAPLILGMSNDYGNTTDFVTDRNSTVILGRGEVGARVEVFVNAVSAGSVTVDSRGFWTSLPIDMAALAMGTTRNVTARQTDAAGNVQLVADAAVTITKQVIGPTSASTIDLANATFTQGLKIIGANPNDQFGTSLALAGDVNNDGRADIIVGAIVLATSTLGGVGEGSVIFGKDSYVAGTTIDLRTLVPADGFGVRGEANQDQAGWSVAGLGDINGDGIADVATGAWVFRSQGVQDTGAAFIVFGKPTGSTWGSTANSINGIRSVISSFNFSPSDGFLFRGLSAVDRVGNSMTGAGDMNGDGIADFAIGGYLVDRLAGNGQTVAGDVGEVYLIFGKASGSYGTFNSATGRNEMSGLDVTAANGIVIRGGAVSDQAGWAISSAGDVNGDGIADLIVGAPTVDQPNFGNAGAAYVIYGKKPGDTWNTIADPLNPGRRILDLGQLQSSDGFMIQGENNQNAQAGYSVDSAGDVNGDGFADLVVGGYVWNNGLATTAGAAYVVFGSATGQGTISQGRQVLQLSSLTTAQGFLIRGINTDDQTGRAVSKAGDLNGDGVDDLAVGVWLSDRGAALNTGSVYVIYGKKNGGDGWGQSISGQSILNLANFGVGDGLFIQGSNNPVSDKQTGRSLAGLGDFNRDGIADLGIGITLSDAKANNSGEVNILYGSTAYSGGLALSGSSSANTLIGSTLSDTINGLGGADVIFGFEGDDNIVLTDTGFERIDGGAGSDTLRLAAGVNLDLTGVTAGVLTSIERIDLVNGNAPNTLTLSRDAILAISSDARLIVDRETADTVNATGFTATGGYGFIGNKVYDVLTNGAATLWLQSTSAVAGTEGLDTLTPAAGAAVVFGFGSDDLITVADTAFARIDGGAGFDTLRLANAGQTLDLTTLPAGRLTGIERIDLANGGANTLVLSQQTVLDLSPTTDRLIVNVDASDTVTMPGFTWSGLSQTFGTSVYDNYVSVSANRTAQVWLQRLDAQTGTIGNDTLTAVAGATRTFALAGDDTITITDAGFLQVDGGTGFDTLKLGTTNQALNLDSLASGAVSGIERIDMTGSGANNLVVGVSRLLDLSSTSDRLIVDMDSSGDTVDLTGWTLSNSQALGANVYNVYTGGAGAELWVQRFNGLIGTMGVDALTVAATAGSETFALAGDDTLTASNLLFGRIDGGVGNDILNLSNAGTAIDLGLLPAGTITNIEVFNLTGGQANTLTIAPALLQTLSDSSDRIFIWRDAADTVTTTGFTFAGISGFAGPVPFVVYDVRTAQMPNGGGASELFIQRATAVVGDNNAQTLTAPAGASVVFAYGGDDTINVVDTSFTRIHGGTGLDTIRLTGAGAVNLTAAGFANGQAQDIERLNVAGNGANNAVTVSAAAIIAMSTTTDVFYVDLDAGDTINAAFAGFTQQVGTVSLGAVTYNIWTLSSATLYIQQGGTVI